DPKSPQDYTKTLARLQDVGPLNADQTQFAKKYAHAILKLRPLPIRSFSIDYSTAKDTFHPLNGQLSIKVASLPEMRAAKDLKTFADWALHSKDPDLLAES
ncbi:MAG: hypothetical protein AABZ44_01645, partial [Elusimicrobiota bacterium]